MKNWIWRLSPLKEKKWNFHWGKKRDFTSPSQFPMLHTLIPCDPYIASTCWPRVSVSWHLTVIFMFILFDWSDYMMFFHFYRQRAALSVLRRTNCLGVGILASLGHNVPRFKTGELTDRFFGLPQGRPASLARLSTSDITPVTPSRHYPRFLLLYYWVHALLSLLPSCCTRFYGPVVMGFFIRGQISSKYLSIF